MLSKLLIAALAVLVWAATGFAAYLLGVIHEHEDHKGDMAWR